MRWYKTSLGKKYIMGLTGLAMVGFVIAHMLGNLSIFGGAEGITNVTTGSAFRSDFAETYGVRLLDGVFAGLTARAIVVIDASGTVVHTELVGEMVDEPDYDAALAALV